MVTDGQADSAASVVSAAAHLLWRKLEAPGGVDDATTSIGGTPLAWIHGNISGRCVVTWRRIAMEKRAWAAS